MGPDPLPPPPALDPPMVCTKANRTLGFLRRNLYSCPPDVKEAAYKGLVRPVLKNGSSVWDPRTHGLQEELEKVDHSISSIK